MNRLQALADSFCRMNNALDPQSDAYKSKNPGGLKAFSIRHEMDDKGFRVFDSFMDGYQALLYDLRLKCSGNSRSRVKPQSTLRELVLCYGQPETAADYIVKFLRQALGDDAVSATTTLNYFLR